MVHSDAICYDILACKENFESKEAKNYILLWF